MGLAHLVALQRSAGNSAVAARLQPKIGWSGGGKLNQGERDTAGTQVTRIPVEGVPEGRAPGRAIIAVPHGGKAPDTVDILFHLHGWHLWFAGAGYAEHGSEVDDESVYRIEQQLGSLATGGRALIAVLPQGPLGRHLEKKERENVSQFGRDDASVDVPAYITHALELAKERWPYAPQPKQGRVILSGHSGAGEPLSTMFDSSVAHDKNAKKHSLLPDRPKLEAFISFDTINGPGQYASHRAFLIEQLERDLKAATAAAGGDTGPAGIAAAKADLDANGFRFRAVYSHGYASWYDHPKDAKGEKLGLKQAFEDWLATRKLPPELEAAFRRNYTFTPAGVEHMEMIGGVKDGGGRRAEHLKDALASIP
jgi:hypothetical protein